MSLNIMALATDKEASVKGVEKEWKGAKVVVARANNSRYLEFIRDQYNKNREAIERKDANADIVAEKIQKLAFCKFVLVGWSGFVTPDGEDMPYNLANAKKVYDAVEDLVRDVRLMASDDDNYRVAALKSDAEELKK